MVKYDDFDQALEGNYALCNRWVDVLGLCHRQTHRQDDQVNHLLINLGYVNFNFQVIASNKKAPRG
jgi:hypothetical protein